jgi:hypothetical protein
LQIFGFEAGEFGKDRLDSFAIGEAGENGAQSDARSSEYGFSPADFLVENDTVGEAVRVFGCVPDDRSNYEPYIALK